MKSKWFFSLLIFFIITACAPNTAPPPVDDVATIVAATLQAASAQPENATEPPPTPTAFQGISFAYDRVSFVLPPGIAVGANGEMIPAETDPETTLIPSPAHIQITLTGYVLPNTFLQPMIYVFPASEYATILPSAGETILKIQTLTSAVAPDFSDMPHVPFFNAGAMFHAQTAVIPFQNGSGIRTVTQYAQFYAQANNYSLFYLFQGLTQDGAYYVVVVLPINMPALASDDDAAPPAGGIPFPSDPANIDAYYQQITALLNGTAPDAFTPSLQVLDQIIQSLRITTP